MAPSLPPSLLPSLPPSLPPSPLALPTHYRTCHNDIRCEYRLQLVFTHSPCFLVYGFSARPISLPPHQTSPLNAHVLLELVCPHKETQPLMCSHTMDCFNITSSSTFIFRVIAPIHIRTGQPKTGTLSLHKQSRCIASYTRRGKK